MGLLSIIVRIGSKAPREAKESENQVRVRLCAQKPVMLVMINASGLFHVGQVLNQSVKVVVEFFQFLQAALVAQVEKGELKGHSGHYFQLRLGGKGLRRPAAPEVIDHLFRLSGDFFVASFNSQGYFRLPNKLNRYVLFICQDYQQALSSAIH